MVAQLLQVQNISKSFPGVRSLDRVSFEVKSGEVHALVGENGARKSIPINIIAGNHQLPIESRLLILDELTAGITEQESLSPLVVLQPDDEVHHTEEWELIEGVAMPANKEDELTAVAQKYITG